MRAEHSQMWPRRFRGWQGSGAVGCGGRGAGQQSYRVAGPWDSAGQSQGREAPGPAVRGQQRAALGLQQKLRGVGLGLPLGWGSCWVWWEPQVESSRGEGVVGGARGEGGTFGVAGVCSWVRDSPPHERGRSTARSP